MNIRTILFAALLSCASATVCLADCSCSDWISKKGYCVDYVKSRIPSFPLPKSHAEAAALRNSEVSAVEDGDVAIFRIGSYWHVAYVERVRRDAGGVPLAVDVSEMNFGGDLSLDEFRRTWGDARPGEWKRALCCGVTDGYNRVSTRSNVPVDSIEQIWSPDNENRDKGPLRNMIGRFGGMINQIIDFAREVL